MQCSTLLVGLSYYHVMGDLAASKIPFNLMNYETDNNVTSSFKTSLKIPSNQLLFKTVSNIFIHLPLLPPFLLSISRS